MRSKASAEKSNKALQTTLAELNKKIEEGGLTIGTIEGIKRKISADNADLLRCVGDLDNNLCMLTKVRNDIGGQLNEAKMIADNESRERQLLLGKFRNLEHEVDGAKENLDEEASSLSNILRSLSKSEGEAQM